MAKHFQLKMYCLYLVPNYSFALTSGHFLCSLLLTLWTFQLNGVCFLGLLLHHPAGAHLLQEDTLLQYRGDTLLPRLQREEQLLPLPLLNEGHHHLHHQSVGSPILHLPNKEAPQSPRDVRLHYHQSIGKGLPRAGLRVSPGHHNQTKGIRPHHGLELLKPPQALHLFEEERRHHPKEGSPLLQVLGPLGESPGLRNPKRQKSKNILCFLG